MVRATGDCERVLDGQQIASYRVRVASACIVQLAEYRALLERVDAAEAASPGACQPLRSAITDRAYDAELAARVLTRHGIDAINELRDAGQLGTHALSSVGQTGGREIDIAQVIQEAKGAAAQAYPELGERVFDEAIELIAKRGLSARVRGNQIILAGKAVDGRERRVAISLAPRNGSLARVAPAQFFAANRSASRYAIALPAFSPESCHHRERQLEAIGAIPLVDAYSSLLAGFAAANQMMYRHARTVDEIGHGRMRGGDPVSLAIGIIAALVGIVLIIVGAATGNTALWVAGIILVAGGICVAAGLCSLIVAGLTVVAA